MPRKVPARKTTGGRAIRARAPEAPKLGGQYLTFILEGQEYGLPILTVHEIVGMRDITRIPRTPPDVLGVLNLRGSVIPVMDLKARLSVVNSGTPEKASIIVVRTADKLMGIVVDQVSEVVRIEDAETEPLPAIGTGQDTRFLLGLGKIQGRVQLLLDIDRALE